MSKSKGNIINPDDYIKKFGADVLRMYLMFLAPFEQGGDFRDQGILGITRFLERIWKFSDTTRIKEEEPDFLERLLNQTIKKLTEDINTLKYNTAISALMILFAEIEQYGSSDITWSIFLKLLAPFAPYLSEELWEKLGHKTSIHQESWPQYDPKLIQEENFELVIQINGKVRDKVAAQTNISQKQAEELALSREKIKIWLKDGKVKKVVFVPNRLINLMIN